MSEKIRLSKLMSERGICSRRDADRHIERGNVLVNGSPITELGTRVERNVEVELLTNEKPITVILNKPIGVVSTQPEKGYTAAIELIQQDSCADDKIPVISRHKMLSCAGRLDIDSKGLLVLTQDGVIAKQLIGEHSNIEKEYLVRVEGEITPKKLALLCKGLALDGQPLKEAKVSLLQPGLMKFILKQGKKRQIRRMCEAVDLKVTGLKRVRIGKVMLGDLPEGKWRILQPRERF